MAPKRRRSESEENVTLKKMKSVDESELTSDQKDINNEASYKEIINHLYKQEDNEGRTLYDMFDTLPSREKFPVYYQFITSPIDLKSIKKKISTHKYSSMDDLESDVMQLIQNAHAFNEPRSQISKVEFGIKMLLLSSYVELQKAFANRRELQDLKDATQLKRAFISKKQEMIRAATGGKAKKKSRRVSRNISMDSEYSEEPETLEETDGKKEEKENSKMEVEQAKEEVIEITRVRANIKKPKEDSSPIKIEALKKPSTVEETDESVEDLIEKAIKQEHIQVFQEYELQGTPEMSQDTQDSPIVQDNVTASPRQSGHADRKDNGLIDATFEPNPFSILYNAVVSYSDQTGRQLALPFIRLPVKRVYPDYYEIIKRPLSLGKIRTKIRASYYSDINILEKDLNCCFNNALEYNKPGSEIYKDAVTLRAVMMEKKAEIEKSEQYRAMRETLPARRSTRIHKKEMHSYEKELKRGRPKVPKSETDGPHTPGSASKRNKVHREEDFPYADVNDPDVIKKRMQQLYTCVYDYKDSEGRYLSEMFRELPDKNEYPDYYKVIPSPIDLRIIREKIDSEAYKSEEELMEDFEIMFQNARHYNEENSEIYEDSVTLEKALKKKRRWLSHAAESKNTTPHRQTNSPSTVLRRTYTPIGNKCQELLFHIRNYTDEHGRLLSAPFERLPSRIEYPDYYQLIKKPIDLAFIISRVNKYTTLDDLEQDLLLMFDNACHFNEPNSQLYKDALTLLRCMIKKKAELMPVVDHVVPNVQVLVQKLLKTLYNNVMNHKDEEGRVYSDSLLEVMATHNDNTDLSPILFSKRKPVSLPIIGQLLNLRFYKRLDQLQDDMFSIFKKARREGTTDSEMYEDACEMHLYFVSERDKLCKDGLRMTSRALNSILKSLQNEIEAERKAKLHMEHEEEDEDDPKRNKFRLEETTSNHEVQPTEEQLTFLKSVVINEVTYRIGDFAYIKPEKESIPPHIFSVDKIWQQKDGTQGFHGCWHYRPEATFHLASRKFLQKEVFRSYRNSSITVNDALGRCYVMGIKEFSTLKPEGFKDEDVYVCESRYNIKGKTFKKMKNYPAPASHIIMLNRSEPLQLKRVSIGFSGSSSQNDKRDKDENKSVSIELESVEGYEFDREKNYLTDVQNPQEGCTYYEKYVTENFILKVGDGVYIDSDEGYLLIAKINRIWTTKTNEGFIQGNWYLWPEDTKHIPTQFFHENECFESSLEEVIPISKVKGKCVILNLRDYQASRPTEVKEEDVYLCSAHYNEDELKFRRNVKGFRPLNLKNKSARKQRTMLSASIGDDEYWYFEQPYQPRKRPSQWLMSKDSREMTKKEGEQNEETDTSAKESEGQSNEAHKDAGDKENDIKAAITLLKKELTEILTKETPDIPTEEIDTKSKEKWESLSPEEQNEYKERAKTDEEWMDIYECAWLDCEYQFEDLQDLMVHVMEGPHIIKSALRTFPCGWRNCKRNEQNNQAFLTHSRIVRHIREIHFKHAYKKISTKEKSKYYFPRHQTCDDGERRGSESSGRSSSHGSIDQVLSPNQPKNPFSNMQPLNVPPRMPPPSSMYPNLPPSAMQMQAGMYAPFRMNNASNPQQALIQQQILQQQMILQARGQILAQRQQQPQNNPMMTQNSPMIPQNNSMIQHHLQQQQSMQQIQQQQQQQSQMQHQTLLPPPSPHNQQLPVQPQPHHTNPISSQPNTQTPPPQKSVPTQDHGPVPGLSLEQQQMLLNQVQRQQQQIQQLQQQVQQLSQEKQAEEQAPVFVAPPPKTQSLRHSEAYLRYIEGLRDNQRFLSNWSQLADKPHTNTSNKLPYHWLAENHGYENATEALWALRDHMLRDAVTLSKLV